LDHREIEVKLEMEAPRTRVAARLRALGATLHRPRHFEDNQILDDASGKLRRKGHLLRVRTAGRDGLLTFKGPSRILGGAKARIELETKVAEPEALIRLLGRIGFRPVFRYQKYRTLYRHAKLLIAVDETPIGNYLELEGSPAGILRFSRRLGYDQEDFITHTYHELFLAYRRKHRPCPREMTFGITPSR
jgi:adenylate cyclase, class 2